MLQCVRMTGSSRNPSRCKQPVKEGKRDCGRHGSLADAVDVVAIVDESDGAGPFEQEMAADPFTPSEVRKKGNAPRLDTNFSERHTYDLVAGGMTGVHVGDSLGASAEFMSRQRAAQVYPSDPDKVRIIGGGPFGWDIGAATDDTDLTVAVDNAYANLGPDAPTDHIVRAAADNMLDWYNSGPKDIGGATSRALSRYKRERDPFTSGVTDESGQGNGSLMRTIPVAFAHANNAERREQDARAISAVTHAHPVCQDACVAYCDLTADLATRRISNSAQLDERLEQLATNERFDPSVRKAIRDGMELEHISDLPRKQDGSGWVNYSLTISVWAARDPRPAHHVLVDIVRHGGDADTNGAIAGGVLGVRDGHQAWPQQWRSSIEYGGQMYEAADDYTKRLS